MKSKVKFKLVFVLILITGISFAQKETNTSEYPNMFVCKLTMKINRAIYVGSGVILNHNTLLTNAHNVFQKDSIIIEPGHNRSNSAPFGKIKIKCEKGVNVFYSDKFDSGDDTYDFAIVKFPDSIVTEQLKRVSNQDYLKIQNLENITELNITGYPVYNFFEFRKDNGDVQYHNSTKKFSYSNNNLLINYKLNTRGGSSGSPLWVKFEDKYYIIGIHKSGKIKNNQGIIYDLERLNLIKKWANY